jgi:hypothetical protein
MRRLLPSARETALFAVVAVVCAVIAWLGTAPEVRLAILSTPLFFVAAMMGLRRNQKLARVPVDQRRK